MLRTNGHNAIQRNSRRGFDVFRQGTFKRFVVQMQQIEIEIQRLIDACARSK
jgi:hypothetical protein